MRGSAVVNGHLRTRERLIQKPVSQGQVKQETRNPGIRPCWSRYCMNSEAGAPAFSWFPGFLLKTSGKARLHGLNQRFRFPDVDRARSDRCRVRLFDAESLRKTPDMSLKIRLSKVGSVH